MDTRQRPQLLKPDEHGPLATSGLRWAVLLLHGFTAGPQTVLPWGQALAAAGATVKVPLLTGHGTSVKDLARSTAGQWRADVQQSLDQLLRQDFDYVAVGGISMGGALALDAAANRPVAATLVINPALSFRIADQIGVYCAPILRHLIPTVAPLSGDIRKPGVSELAYDHTPVAAVEELAKLFWTVRRNLPKISTQVRFYRSMTDHIVPSSSGKLLQRALDPDKLSIVPLPKSYHVATLDHDAKLIQQDSIDLLRRISGGHRGTI